MAIKTKKAIKNARFDMKLPEEQKRLFEKAAILGGYRNLSEFVSVTVQQKSEEIISRHTYFAVSQQDRELFWDAIMNPPKPNEALLKAAEEYKKDVTE